MTVRPVMIAALLSCAVVVGGRDCVDTLFDITSFDTGGVTGLTCPEVFALGSSCSDVFVFGYLVEEHCYKTCYPDCLLNVTDDAPVNSTTNTTLDPDTNATLSNENKKKGPDANFSLTGKSLSWLPYLAYGIVAACCLALAARTLGPAAQRCLLEGARQRRKVAPEREHNEVSSSRCCSSAACSAAFDRLVQRLRRFLFKYVGVHLPAKTGFRAEAEAAFEECDIDDSADQMPWLDCWFAMKNQRHHRKKKKKKQEEEDLDSPPQLEDLADFLRLPKTGFHALRLFALYDTNNLGHITFGDFLRVSCHCCSSERSSLELAFCLLADTTDTTETFEARDLEAFIASRYHQEDDNGMKARKKLARRLVRAMATTTEVTMEQFTLWSKAHPVFVRDARSCQAHLREAILGAEYWQGSMKGPEEEWWRGVSLEADFNGDRQERRAASKAALVGRCRAERRAMVFPRLLLLLERVCVDPAGLRGGFLKWKRRTFLLPRAASLHAAINEAETRKPTESEILCAAVVEHALRESQKTLPPLVATKPPPNRLPPLRLKPLAAPS